MLSPELNPNIVQKRPQAKNHTVESVTQLNHMDNRGHSSSLHPGLGSLISTDAAV